MKLEQSFEVQAPIDTVWSALVDLERYRDWNPFLVEASGTVSPGERLRVRFRAPGHRAVAMRPTVIGFEPGRTFRWLGRLGIPGIFDGEHSHEVEAVDGGGSRYVQREEFRGVLVPFVGGLISDTQRGFRAMNEALKARLEACVGPPAPTTTR
jgi:hypothetical protein